MVIGIDNSQDLPEIQLPTGRRLQQAIELLADHTKGQAAEHPVEIHPQLGNVPSLNTGYISILRALRQE
jgi:hypothetical protein